MTASNLIPVVEIVTPVERPCSGCTFPIEPGATYFRFDTGHEPHRICEGCWKILKGHE